MPIESATYISQLVTTNPQGTDLRSTADDHLRLIKSSLTSSFVNVRSEISASASEFNALVGSVGLVASVGKDNVFTGTNTLPDIKDYGVTHTTPTIAAGAITFDMENGNSFNVSLNANITSITLSNPQASGTYCEIVIEFLQDATGSRTVAGWPAAVQWIGGNAPTITATATTGRDKVYLSTRDAGTTWLGEYSQDYS